MYRTSLWSEHEKQNHGGREGERGQGSSWDLVVSNTTFYSPAGVELHVRVKEAHDGRRGGVPAVDAGPDQALPLAVPHDLHQARVALVDVLVQVEFQLHWKRADQQLFKWERWAAGGQAGNLPLAWKWWKKHTGLNYISRLWGLLYPKTILCSTSSEILHFWLDNPNWTKTHFFFSFCSQQGYSRWAMNASSRLLFGLIFEQHPSAFQLLARDCVIWFRPGATPLQPRCTFIREQIHCSFIQSFNLEKPEKLLGITNSSSCAGNSKRQFFPCLHYQNDSERTSSEAANNNTSELLISKDASKKEIINCPRRSPHSPRQVSHEWR